VRSRGFGLGDPTPSATTTGAGTLTGGASPAIPYTSRTKTWGSAPSTPVEDRLDINAQNISTVTIDAARARVTCDAQLNITSDGPLDVNMVNCPYARPKGATPLYASLVPAYAPCTSPNRQHGPPLVFGSCNPPQQVSNQLTVGAPDANGQPANSIGSVRYDVVVGNPSTPQSEADVQVGVSMTDVRKSDLSDYTGELQISPSVRITDRNNGSSGSDLATTEDSPLPMTASCVATSSTSIGGTCSLSSSFNAVVPGAVVEGKRAIWQLGQVDVFDGGADGLASTAPNTLFARQGIFVP
jgi:hypothetical protein